MKKTFFLTVIICLTFVSQAGAAVPKTPSGLNAVSVNATTVNLTWLDNSANETKFKIFRKTNSGPFTLIYTTPKANIKSYSDATAANNTTTQSYSYYIKACNASGCSAQTNSAVVPFKPVTLTATAVSATKVDLKWTDKSSNETAFLIERNVGECTALTGVWSQIETVAAGAQTASDTSVSGDKKYAYRVRAKAQSAGPVATGFSGYSNCKSVKTPTSAGGSIQLPETGQTTSYYEGDDGELQMGVEWPNPRFVSGMGTEAECMIDKLTGLMWPKNGNLAGGTTWQQALDYANGLDYCGHTDWRLPNVNELESLVNAEEPDTGAWLNLPAQGFNNVQSGYTWTSSTYADGKEYAWYVSMWNGYMNGSNKTSNYYSAWPVRAGQPGGTVRLPQTGQQACYATNGKPRSCSGTGEDGEFKMGVAPPDPRFTITYCNASGPCASQAADCDANPSTDMVTDNLTGLVWSRNANRGNATWQGALDVANGSTICGKKDWRLPNRKELFSLVDRAKFDPALPAGYADYFLNVQFENLPASRYWSSGTYYTEYAWFVQMWVGFVYSSSKDEHYYVWPVRGGQ